MSKLTKALTAAAGNAGAGALHVEDVFSTYLYDGNSSTQTITNGIDLSGEGGLVWLKSRSSGANYYDHVFCDTERGPTKYLASSGLLATAGEQTQTQSPRDITSFNSNGFSLGIDNTFFKNVNGQTFASWTFRKAEKFFDVVTYTGNGTSTNNIAHNLGAVPAFVIIKRTDVTQEWVCAHVNLSNLQANYDLHLNDTGAASQQGYASFQWNDTSINVKKVTDTLANANASGGTYVAYLFASDAGGFGDDGSESIIKCGSWDATGNNEVNLGFEPQWILIKNADGGNNWGMFDSMRGWTADGNMQVLAPNLSSAESSESGVIKLTSTGFTWIPAVGGGNTYIYIAIRRPMKTPESGTEVFKTIEQNWSTGILDAGFPVDLAIFQQTDAGNNGRFVDRLRGNTQVLNPNLTSAEGGESYYALDNNEGFELVSSPVSNNWVWWMFKRATGFFDVVAYTGDGVAGRTVAHSLGVAPELVIMKSRSNARNWVVYHAAEGNGREIVLNLVNSSKLNAGMFNNTSPTSNQLTLGNDASVNGSTWTFVAYLFATVAGVSKVGSYTGTGSNVDVDCGFSAGARFILIKRTDSTGDWYVYDSVRGIVAGNDPYLLLNSSAAEVTSTDYIDPLSSGFTVTSSAPAALNASGGNYIFLAIA